MFKSNKNLNTAWKSANCQFHTVHSQGIIVLAAWPAPAHTLVQLLLIKIKPPITSTQWQLPVVLHYAKQNKCTENNLYL